MNGTFIQRNAIPKDIVPKYVFLIILGLGWVGDDCEWMDGWMDGKKVRVISAGEVFLGGSMRRSGDGLVVG